VRIGLLTDTHMPNGLPGLWEEVHQAFAGVDLILHGGDIVWHTVLDELETIAPTLAAKGNNDHGFDDPRMQDIQWIDADGFRIAVVHDMEPEDEPIDELRRKYLKGEHADVMITGHTHFERLDFRDGVLQINSGSAIHPHQWSTRPGTVGILETAPGQLRARILRVGEREGLRNPGIEYEFDGREVRRLDP
jgi:putative phosphoesterase